MENGPTEHRKVLQDIERLLAEAPDEATRAELTQLRDRLSSPALRDMARELESNRPKARGDLVLEFHDPLLPAVFTATGGVVASAICVFAIFQGLEQPVILVRGQVVSLWLVAALAGAFCALFTALSFMRAFSVRIDTEGMASRVSGARWRDLPVGAMSWESIRSLRERPESGVLEVHARTGKIFGIPMRIVNYPILRSHLENMVMLYGDRAPA
jgi:hypothetical protein